LDTPRAFKKEKEFEKDVGAWCCPTGSGGENSKAEVPHFCHNIPP
jgi:hypothetical protein